jgi:hypothetical protein
MRIKREERFLGRICCRFGKGRVGDILQARFDEGEAGLRERV